jgi:hypothetical protein
MLNKELLSCYCSEHITTEFIWGFENQLHKQESSDASSGNSTQTRLQQEIPKSQYLAQKSLCVCVSSKLSWTDLQETMEHSGNSKDLRAIHRILLQSRWQCPSESKGKVEAPCCLSTLGQLEWHWTWISTVHVNRMLMLSERVSGCQAPPVHS